MSVSTKKIVVFGVMTLLAAVISLPVASLAATSPAVTVLSPLAQGLRAPVKMALDASGNVYVADQRVGGIVRYDAYGVQLQTIRTAAAPGGIAFAQDGSLLVSQTTFVARYDIATGMETGRLAGGQLMSAAGIAVDDVTGYIYVTDSALIRLRCIRPPAHSLRRLQRERSLRQPELHLKKYHVSLPSLIRTVIKYSFSMLMVIL